MDCHFVNEKLRDGVIKVMPISSKNQMADLLPKPLHTRQFKFLLSKKGTTNLSPILRGSIGGYKCSFILGC